MIECLEDSLQDFDEWRIDEAVETAKRAITLDKEATFITDGVGNAKVVPLLVQAV